MLNFAMLYMVRNPEVLERVQFEIDTVLGSKCPKLEDRDSLPYTQVTSVTIIVLLAKSIPRQP